MSDTLFKRVPLSTVAVAIKDGTHGTHERVRNGVPFLSAKNITAGGVAFWDETDDCISNSEYEQIHKAFKLQRNDLLLTVVGSIGRRAIFDGSRVTFQRSVAFIRPDHNLISERFLFHWFGHGDFQNELIRRSNSTAQAGIYLGELSKALIPECHIPEQIKIAEILDTIETTIHQTEAIIEKLKQVKQGLMHDLLTRGIDANGELRPPQSEAPELYKESALGWIPREWEAKVLDQLVDSRRPIVYGILMPGQGCEGGVPVVKVKDIYGGSIQLDSLLLTTPEIDREYKRSRLQQGDLLFTIRGTVGRTAFVPASLENANITQDTARVGLRGVDARFVREYLEMDAPKRFIKTNTLGVAVQGINLGDVRKIPIAVPPVMEAEEIAEILDAHNIRMKKEQLQVQKLLLQKSGLMDDLLTGRVRVTPLLESAAA